MPFSDIKIDHQISFVSHQTIPIILGALLAKPKKIHLIKTEEMNVITNFVVRYLKSNNFLVEVHAIKQERDQDLSDIFAGILNQCQENEIMHLNMTNGTKLHALAAMEWVFNNNIPTFYIDTQNDEVVFPNIGTSWEFKELPDILKITDLLQAYGFTIEQSNEEPIKEEKRKAMGRLLEIFCNDTKILSQLNACAADAKARFNKVSQNKYQETSAWNEVLDICEKLGMLGQAKTEIIFKDEDSCNWCNGIWLEEYVASILFKLKQNKDISSWGMSIKVNKDGTRNEMDAMFTQRNRLFSIECKTANLDNNDKGHRPRLNSDNSASGEQNTSYIYKLDSLKEKLGGTFAASMFCSVTKMNNADQKRAKDMGIKLVCGKDLLGLENYIQLWVKQ